MPRLESWNQATRSTLALSGSKLTLWHSVLFSLNIGVPVLAGWLGGSLRLGLLGAVLGLLLSLCDSAEKLPHRLWLLGRAAGLILAFGTLGARLGGYNPCFWISLLALAFAAGWFSLAGRTGAAAFRYAALSLVSAASSPGLGISAVAIFGVTVVTSALTRTFGSYFFPNASLVLPPAARRRRPELLAALRYCTVYASAVALGLFVGEHLGAQRPLWVATTVLLVMQPDAGTSYMRMAQRIFGTGVGVMAAGLVVHFVHSETWLALSIVVISFVFPHGSTRNYWLHSAFAAWLVLVLTDFALAGQPFDTHLLIERVRDVGLGCAIALVATLLARTPPKKAAA
jgi:hypothetical protein